MQYWELNDSKTSRNPFLLLLFAAVTLLVTVVSRYPNFTFYTHLHIRLSCLLLMTNTYDVTKT